jgi:3-deoxy-manno-octulosonate cytidylyltransferase (CMP-KDO synthetase)
MDPDTIENNHDIAPHCLVMIPARMASTRLPDKPLAEIGGVPMIVQVMRRALEAEIGKVIVATDHDAIAEAVTMHGGEAVMTSKNHQSGSDRIWEAVQIADPGGNAEFIVNVQGDLPTISGAEIRASLAPLIDGPADIATLAAEIRDDDDRDNPNIVKLVGSPTGQKRMRALYFTRARAPWGEGPLYHHIGLYAYRRAALERFVSLGPSLLERREKLEQLRALEAGMRIDATIVDSVPLGVDTQAELALARQILGGGQ